jgi:UDP-2,4-diacetamido-2,4,6-trideoxy-beta-L-altropyranose hydrolase
MRFIFRADASREIGSGHVMRASVLAEEAISRGIECIFVGRILELDWVSERIVNLGFTQLIADERNFKADKDSDVLILDTYVLLVSNPFIARKNWKLVLSICDAITPKYDSDIELRPGLAVVHSESEVPIVLSGPEYVLIRKNIRKSTRERSFSDVLRVLIVGGGSDPFGFVQAIADVFSSLELNMEVHAFTEGRIPEDSEVHFVRHSIGSDLDKIARDIDLAFTTASSSSLEFIAREIPTAVVCAVDNQESYYSELGRLGCAVQVGVYHANGSWEFNLPAIKDFLESQSKQRSLKDAMHLLIDLKGAARVINNLITFAERDGN